MKISKLALALPLAALLVTPAAAQGTRALSVEQEKVAGAKPEVEAFTITATLSNVSGQYRIGEKVGLTVRMDRDAYLLVVNADTHGNFTVLYPNDFNTQSFLEGGVDHEMPGPGARIVASGPEGLELVKIIASETPFDPALARELLPNGPFLTSPAGAATALSRALTVVPTEQEPTPSTPSEPAEPPVAEEPTEPPVIATPTEPSQPPVDGGAEPKLPAAWGQVVVIIETIAADAPAQPQDEG